MSYYALNETSGTVVREAQYGLDALDRSGTLVGSPTLGAVSLIGTGYAIQTTSSSYISIPVPTDQLGSLISMRFWFRYVSGPILFRDNRSTGGWYCDISGTNPVISVEGVPHTVTGVTSASLKTGRHQFALTVDGGANNHLYLDKVLVDTWHTGFPDGGDLASKIFLGKDGANSTYSPNVYAAFTISSGIMSPSEIAADYDAADEVAVAAAPVTVTALPVAVGHPGMAEVTVTALPVESFAPVLTQAHLALASSTVTTVDGPPDAPDPRVEPIHVVSPSVPVPTLVNGVPQ